MNVNIGKGKTSYHFLFVLFSDKKSKKNTKEVSFPFLLRSCIRTNNEKTVCTRTFQSLSNSKNMDIHMIRIKNVNCFDIILLGKLFFEEVSLYL